MARKIIKITIRVLICLIIGILLWLYVGFVLTPKRYEDTGGDYYFAYKSIFDEKPNSIDVMFSGNSNCFKSCIPIEFYNSTGATCYNIGGSIQSAQSMEARIKSVLKKQSPKLMIIDVDCLYYSNKYFTGSTKYKWLPVIAPVFYHSRWKEVKFLDLFSPSHDDKNFMKGYVKLTEASGFKIKDDYMKHETKEIENLTKSVSKNIHNIYNICKENNIKMLFISVPTPATWSNERHNGIQQLADEFGIDYLDMNMPDVQFGFDYSLHIADKGYHCNWEGAKLVTKYVSDYVNENFELEDRRLNPDYSNWNNLYQDYLEYMYK